MLTWLSFLFPLIWDGASLCSLLRHCGLYSLFGLHTWTQYRVVRVSDRALPVRLKSCKSTEFLDERPGCCSMVVFWEQLKYGLSSYQVHFFFEAHCLLFGLWILGLLGQNGSNCISHINIKLRLAKSSSFLIGWSNRATSSTLEFGYALSRDPPNLNHCVILWTLFPFR